MTAPPTVVIDRVPAIERALSELLEAAEHAGASDVHVTAGSPPFFRIDGTLKLAAPQAWDRIQVASALRSLLTDAQADQFDRDHELDIAFSIPSGRRFRVNLFRERGASAAAFRIVPRSIPSLEELGLPAQIARFAALDRGLVLVTGPTGMGKSTTIAALVDLINRTSAKHIMTVEDPIEYLHPNIRSLVQQREVGSDTRSFAESLRRLLRQDPDVIMVSDLRDRESIEFALTAADTGHLVFATLHTQSAAQTLTRLADVFDGNQQQQVRMQLASALKGVVSQTLIPRSDGGGRLAAVEIMVTNPAIANLIRDDRAFQIPSIMMTRGEDGMVTMDQSLAEFVNAGTLAFEAGLARAHDTETFRQLVRRRLA